MIETCCRCAFSLLCDYTGLGHMRVAFVRCVDCEGWFVELATLPATMDQIYTSYRKHHLESPRCPQGVDLGYCPDCELAASRTDDKNS